MKRIIAALMIFMTGAMFQTSTAQVPHPAVHKQIREERRIHHGVATGKLTHKEAAHLQMQQAKIHHDKKCARADGVVTPYERAQIRAGQAHASRSIYHQKHDGQNRF